MRWEFITKNMPTPAIGLAGSFAFHQNRHPPLERVNTAGLGRDHIR